MKPRDLANERQAGDRRTPPGPNTLYYNGTVVTLTNEGGRELKTRGPILLSEDGGTVYVAWNEWQYSEKSETWFYQLKWGELSGATCKVRGRDRTGKRVSYRTGIKTIMG